MPAIGADRGAARAGSETALSIVIPAYKAKDTIAGTVRSALSQNGGEVVVLVVVDDGSAETVERVEALGDPRVRLLVNERNLGAPVSRNRGLAVADTPYVAFLDADDHFIDDLLGPLVRKMKENGAKIGFGPTLNWDPRGGYSRHFVPNYADHADVFLRWLSGVQNVIATSVAWSTDYLREIGGWDETLRRNQDGELALRAMLLGAAFVQSDQGAGVWVNDRRAARITTRTDNLPALLDVVDKLGAVHSTVIPDDIRRQAFAGHYLVTAHVAFRAGADEVGREALRRRRALGYADSVGPLKYRFSAALRILPPSLRRRLWQLIELRHGFGA